MTFSRLTLAGAVLVIFGMIAVPANAQSMWQQAFGYQIAELLESPDATMRADAMRTFIKIADQKDRNVALGPAANALLDVYETSPLPSHRLMAVVALSKIDDRPSYTRLLNAALGENDLAVRHAILHAAVMSRSIRSPFVANAYNQLLRHNVLQADTADASLSSTF